MKLAFRILSFLGSIFLLFFMGIIVPFVCNGGKFPAFIVASVWAPFFYIPFSAAVLSYGLRHALWGMAGLSIFLKRTPLATMQEMVIRSSIRYVYATGVIVLLLHLVLLISVIPSSLTSIFKFITQGIVSIFCSVLISEFILRPILKRSELLRLEQTTGETHPSFKDLWFPSLICGIIIGSGMILFGLVIYSALHH